MGATTLTAIPEGDTLGQVNLPGHVDYRTFQIIATAGSVQAHDGQAHGYGSDLYKAQLIELLGMGTSVEEARQKAESLISFYSKDVRMVCAKIIAYLQTEKNMAYIPGEMLHEIEERARYELKTRNVKFNSPAFFKAPTPEEKAAKKQKEDTVGRPPDERTAMGLMEGNLGKFIQTMKLPTDEVLGLGRIDPNNSQEGFTMTVLALRFSRSANGVSELHGKVSRNM